jgi:glycosyltransferase involved in cell wall biosynthesis
MPKLFIGMPSYNSSPYIAEAINSILSQSFRDFELLISDNSSTDNTVQIAEDIARCDSRVRVIRQSRNFGSLANFRYLQKVADTPFFMWASSHDRWDEQYVEKLVSLLEASDEAVLGFGRTIFIDGIGNNVENAVCEMFDCQDDQPIRRALKIVQSLNCADMVYGIFRKRALDQCRVDLNCIGPDHLLLLEIAFRGKIVCCDQAVFYRREYRDLSSDEYEFRWQQLNRLLGRPPTKAAMKNRYAIWLWQHFLSSVKAPGLPQRRLINGMAVSYAFVIRWNQYLAKYLILIFRVLSPLIRFLQPLDGPRGAQPQSKH